MRYVEVVAAEQPAPYIRICVALTQAQCLAHSVVLYQAKGIGTDRALDIGVTRPKIGTMTNNDIAQSPNRIPWPPLIYIAVLLAAWGLQTLWPGGALLAGLGMWPRVVGVVLALAGVGLDLAAMRAMHRAKTNVLPHRGAQHLVTEGVFAFSRNPIYLGNALLMIGVALVVHWPWLLVGALLSAALVDRLAIRREERHLSARFGDAFANYTRRVPRWIGWRRHRSDQTIR